MFDDLASLENPPGVVCKPSGVLQRHERHVLQSGLEYSVKLSLKSYLGCTTA
jgi:hypothetical protein